MSHVGQRLTAALGAAAEGARQRLQSIRVGNGIPKRMRDAVDAEEAEFRRVSEIMDRWLHGAGDHETSDVALIEMLDRVAPLRPMAKAFPAFGDPITPPPNEDAIIEAAAIAAGVIPRPPSKPIADNPFEADRRKTSA